MTEADTCRKYVVPLMVAAGWDNDPHSIAEQRTFTDGRIIVHGGHAKRRPGKRPDYLLRYTRDFPVAIVEAKAIFKKPADGLQQAKDDAIILGLPVAYSTNGEAIVEFDFTTGQDAPTCRNAVLVRLVNSMVEFKQIVGHATRERGDYGKLWFKSDVCAKRRALSSIKLASTMRANRICVS